MTNKERIEKMRETARLLSEEADRIADTLDPPRPKPGTVVWWKWDNKIDWRIGEVAEDGKGIVARVFSWADHVAPWDRIEWKPARIAGPDEVVVPIDELLIELCNLDDGRSVKDHLFELAHDAKRMETER